LNKYRISCGKKGYRINMPVRTARTGRINMRLDFAGLNIFIELDRPPLPIFVASKRLTPFISNELMDGLLSY
jgi:hypothetical protein